MTITHSVLVFFILGYPDVSTTILDGKNIERTGFCHGDSATIQCRPNCTFSEIHWKKGDSSKEIGKCNGLGFCQNKPFYTIHNGIYKAHKKINYKEDIKLWACVYKCDSHTSSTESTVHIKPCAIAFGAIKNKTHITCTHDDFKHATKMGIRKSSSDSELGSCMWNGNEILCHESSSNFRVGALPNGLIVTLPKNGQGTYSCIMDGQTKDVVELTQARNLKSKGNQPDNGFKNQTANQSLIIAGVLFVILYLKR